MGLMCAAASAVRAAPGEERFGPDERRDLAAGKLVTRPVVRQQGSLRLIGGTSWQRIDAPPDRVWAVAKDVRRYGEFLPGVDEARVVAEGDDERIVRMRHRVGFATVSYCVRMRVDDSRRMLRFALDETRPHDIRAGYGFFMVGRADDGRATTTWGVLADAGSGLVSGLLRPVVRNWMLRVPNELRKLAER